MVSDAVSGYFYEGKAPARVRLHFVHDPVFVGIIQAGGRPRRDRGDRNTRRQASDFFVRRAHVGALAGARDAQLDLRIRALAIGERRPAARRLRFVFHRA
jgi:hypothetical protein